MTRGDYILDLVITDDPDAVGNISELGLFATSDHKAITFQLRANPDLVSRHNTLRNYRRADKGGFDCP